VACKEWNEQPAGQTTMAGGYTNPVQLNANCYTHIRFVENEVSGLPVWRFVKDQCLHCVDPPCAAACPVAALTQTVSGAVTYDYDRCIGCRYCMLACPFRIPKYEWNSPRPWVQKCTFCADRIGEDMPPACVKTCPTGALFYGEYDTVLAEGEKRIGSRPARYVPHIYGEREAGGTRWVYVSDVPFESLGFRMRVPATPLPALTWSSLSKVPLSMVGLVAVLSGIAYFKNRGTGENDSDS